MPKTISGKVRRVELRKKPVKPYERRVNYYETDKMNIVHHSNYLRYFEEARLEFMRAIGCAYEDIEEEGLIIPVVNASVKYILPLRYGEDFLINVTLESFNGIKLCFNYRVERGGELVTEGHTEHCFVNQSFRPVNIKRKAPKLFDCFAAAVKE